jgi:glycosyltransferase involved in cell wall biosynthesis
VVLEALSSGLYVLASETMRGVFDDFCEEGALEYLDTSPRPLSRRLQALCENPPPLDDDLRDALHRRVESQYDWKRVTGELFEWFDRLLETRRQTRSPGPPPAHRTDDPSAVARQQVDAR